jgi:NAD(P)-dependent dehydrogenase (short-subunit alcohol dehydrogenase family)
MRMPNRPVVFLSSITSDIGIALAQRYSADGYIVTGTYRSEKLLPTLRALTDCHLFYCDLAEPTTIASAVDAFAKLGLAWETFVSLASHPPPLCGFFEGDFSKWSESIHINCIEQLRTLCLLYPLRCPSSTNNAVFFAGPGTNNAVTNFSALTLSKIMLIKMCELLDAETPDLNTFIVGPGWTKTKTHDTILSDPQVSPEKRADTLRFLQSQTGTSMDDIYNSIRWLCAQGRAVSGGRNFSIVHDLWGSDELANELRLNPDMYKLRRYNNSWKLRPKKNP